MRPADRLTSEELRELVEKAKDLDRRSDELDRHVERVRVELDHLAKKIRQTA